MAQHPSKTIEPDTTSMTTIYCPYTDREIPISESSSEHIVPTSLGGTDGFEIRVDRKFNSIIETRIDGRLANEHFWRLLRTKHDSRGHSGRAPVARFNTAYGKEQRKAQVDLSHSRRILFWDVRDRKYVTVPGEFPISFSINIDLPVRFAAKVALGSGYYVHGESFRNHVDHRQLRDVMNIDPSSLDQTKTLAELGLEHLTLRVDSWMHELRAGDDTRMRFLRDLCNSIEHSVVVVTYSRDAFSVIVGLFGQYLGMVNVPADSETLLKGVSDKWGNVLELRRGGLNRYPLIDGLVDHTDIVASYELKL